MAEPCQQPSVLVIAGTDSSGKAGLARDLATLYDHKVKPLIAVTAVTAQSDDKVYAIDHACPEVVAAQITAALADRSLRAIKIGMLGQAETVSAVVKTLKDAQGIPIICDPVLCSSSGTELLDNEGVEVLRDQLLPLCQLVTPNLPEVYILSGCDTDATLDEVALKIYSPSILIKGGHANSDLATDTLYRNNLPNISFSTPRLDISRRGTGCTLASAIAANIANGLSLEKACQQAKDYLTDWLRK